MLCLLLHGVLRQSNFFSRRHPFLGRYKVGVTEKGEMTALEVDLYANAGCTMDLSFSVVGRAMFHATNSYKVNGPLRVKGYVCKTNLPSNRNVTRFLSSKPSTHSLNPTNDFIHRQTQCMSNTFLRLCWILGGDYWNRQLYYLKLRLYQ